MTKKQELVIVALGDSITQATTQMPDESKRWLSVLGGKLKNEFPEYDFKIINSGVGGNSDHEKMLRLNEDVLAHDPDYLLLEFGGNNSGFGNPNRYVSPAQSFACLERVKDSVSAKTKIMLITFPQLIEELHAKFRCGGRDTSSYFDFFAEFGGADSNIELYREKTREFAGKYNLPLIDFYKSMKAEPDSRSLTLDDGVHLSVSGNELLGQCVFDALAKELL